MSRKMAIIAMVFVSSLLSFSGCAIGDSYHTYRLQGSPLTRETKNFLIFWISGYSDDGQELNVPNNINGARESKNFSFNIAEHGSVDNRPLLGMERTINTEPYTLFMAFDINNAKNIIVNKLIFRTRNKVVDLRETVGVTYRTRRSGSYTHFTEKEITYFRKAGIIDIVNLINEQRIIDRLSFRYENVDVNFNRDGFFTIECDITFESDIEGYETENYRFTAKFLRKKYAEERISLSAVLILYILFGKELGGL
jgi:hypothetical protein